MEKLSIKIKKKYAKIAVVGLGYVGLPVAIAFSKKFNVVGFDIDNNRIRDLRRGKDLKNTLKKKDQKNLKKVYFSSNINSLIDIDIFIITTPTPVFENKRPDLKLVFKALDIFKNISISNKLIILESTVYPEASEKEFIPYLELITKKKINKDFLFGYSPERINPGDKNHNFQNIDKIVSGSNGEALKLTKNLYKNVVNKIHTAKKIKIAEMAKIIENIQRDVNIALINEFSLIANKLSMNSKDVLKLANTKWNFLNFKPGLVGGHCIGVDPYYLIHKLNEKKYKPQLVLSGRNLNEKYPLKILDLFLKFAKPKKVIFLGVTYKGNCNDLRNSKSIDMLNNLISRKIRTDVYDPYYKTFDKNILKKFNFISLEKIRKKYDAVIISVDHDYFKKIDVNLIKKLCKENKKIFDIKNIFPKENFYRI